jgi:hypothetical protein
MLTFTACTTITYLPTMIPGQSAEQGHACAGEKDDQAGVGCDVTNGRRRPGGNGRRARGTRGCLCSKQVRVVAHALYIGRT